MMIEDFGARVASVWEGLRSTTRNLVERALQSSAGAVGASISPQRSESRPYDARADWELSRLLAALDERLMEAGASMNAEQEKELRRMAETTALVLQNQTQSAEVFAQLVARTYRQHDYARIDQLADTLAARFAPSEICELARSNNEVVRALAQEALAQTPTSTLIGLLGDPIDAEIAREALERQAEEYGSEEARRIVHLLDQADMAEDDL
jgi:methylmalonyl-CoA mutase cobalamin-binding subunit